MPFTVWLSENSERGDPHARSWPHGDFASWEDAVAAACRIIDRSLIELHTEGMDPDDLWRHYALFGEDAHITPTPPGHSFIAWDFARERCARLRE